VILLSDRSKTTKRSRMGDLDSSLQNCRSTACDTTSRPCDTPPNSIRLSSCDLGNCFLQPKQRPIFTTRLLAALCSFLRQAQESRFATNLTVSRRLPFANLLSFLIALLSTTFLSEYVPKSSSTLITMQITASFSWRLWNQHSPSIAESRTNTFRMNRSSKSIARDRSLSSFQTLLPLGNLTPSD